MGTSPISLCDTGEVDKSITLNGFFGSPLRVVGKIGRASCRERVWLYV